jgi:hypothetical protein
MGATWRKNINVDKFNGLLLYLLSLLSFSTPLLSPFTTTNTTRAGVKGNKYPVNMERHWQHGNPLSAIQEQTCVLGGFERDELPELHPVLQQEFACK